MSRPSIRRALSTSVTGLALAALVLSGSPSAGASAERPRRPAVAAGEQPVEPGEPGEGDAGEEEPPEVPADPLAVTIDRASPVVPQRGRVVVAGAVTNVSDTTWEALSVYLLTSTEPMTDAGQLSAALRSDPRTDVGDRLIEPGLYVDVPDLEPGEATRFRLSVPRTELRVSGARGVYWLGVHVLGETEGARLEGADGRARTLIPLVPAGAASTRLALGVQFRHHTVRRGDGRLEQVEERRAQFAAGGRLDRLLELSRTAGTWPLTWVVDPVVVDVARSIGRGNPDLSLSADAADPPAAVEGTEEPDSEPDPDTPPEELAAQDWLVGFAEEAAQRPVAALPYAEPDLSAASRYGADELVSRAFTTGAALLDGLSVDATPLVLPPGGYLSADALRELDPDVPVVLAPRAVEPAAEPGTVLGRADGGRILVGTSGGEVLGIGRDRSALAVRQRLLAEAALHALSPRAAEPLVRLLPSRWNPGPGWARAEFFAGLDQPWLSGTTLATVLAGPPSADPVASADVVYPEAAEDAEMPVTAVRAAEALVRGGAVLEELLTENDVIDEAVTRQALTALSVWSRPRPGLAVGRAQDALEVVQGWLDQVSVRSPALVTMSSETGTFNVTVVNGLEEPVTVGLEATALGGGLALRAPGAIQLPPRGRGAMAIDAASDEIGVHQVTLQPVSEAGSDVGQPTTLSIRSSRVGLILWVVMAVGGGVLFVAIVLRIWRRVRQRRRTHGPLLSRAGRP